MLELDLFQKPMLEEDIKYKEAMIETASKWKEEFKSLTNRGIYSGKIYNEEKNIVKEGSKATEYDGSEYGVISFK